ncbi:hypothetical protein BDQ12DRAFT_717277 [Crucibulum laeve]|uniref:DUF6535 domain-containing protein n=1 Tax=Crucibulum laeve TaxID=68775 RepID=A0A5C3MF95_9AGAR|nr:hypothetical protein BDQ12DRAFT_717277 [Crucibulum laeve]
MEYERQNEFYSPPTNKTPEHMPDIDPWKCGETWHHPVPKPKQHWEKCYQLVEKHDKEMCDAWKDEIDKLLIFAGLFSATVTAFTVESYQWLSEAPQDKSVRLLEQLISVQLYQISPNASIPNITISDPFTVSDSAVRINIYWFLSLTLSMATVLIGILAMQWLREFQRDAGRSHKGAIALRQMREEGLIAWKVPYILSTLPLLLQLAFILFFAGVVELLWTLNNVVAGTISCAVGLLFLFLGGTTVLPTMQSIFISDPHVRVKQCPYKSPQSWAFYRLALRVGLLIRSIQARWLAFRFVIRETKSLEAALEEAKATTTLAHFGRFSQEIDDSDWADYDVRWRDLRDATFFDEISGDPCEPQDADDILHALMWINQRFTQDVDTVYILFHCLVDLETQQAAQVISGLYPQLEFLPKLLFPAASDATSDLDAPFTYDVQRREYIFAVFWWLHKNIHPALSGFYFERTIRLINSNAKYTPYIQLRTSDGDLASLDDDDLLQLFVSLKSVVAHDAITVQHASEIWAFLRDLFAQERPIGNQLLTIVFNIFEEFEWWLTRDQDTLIPCVETCVTGTSWIFALLNSEGIFALRKMHGFQKAESLVRTLDEYIDELHMSSKILQGLRKRRWPDLRQKVFPTATE